MNISDTIDTNYKRLVASTEKLKTISEGITAQADAIDAIEAADAIIATT